MLKKYFKQNEFVLGILIKKNFGMLNFLKNNNKLFYNFRLFHFCDKNSSDEKRYEYNYQTPETQNLNLSTLKEKLVKNFIFISIVGLCCYYFLFQKYNNYSKSRKLYLISEICEVKFSQFISSKLKIYFRNYIYKNDSEEAQLVLKIYKNLQIKNKIDVKITKENINVVDISSIGVLICKNGDIFISSRVLELANSNENEIAFFIATELSSLLKGNFTERIFKFKKAEFATKHFHSKNVKHEHEQNKKFFQKIGTHFVDINKFLHFYPENVVTNYYQEIEISKLALQIINNSGYDVVQSIKIMKKFDEKLKSYPRYYINETGIENKSRYYEPLLELIKIYLI